MRHLVTSLICFSGLFVSTGLHAEEYISKKYTFLREQPEIVDNPLLWSASFRCVIATETDAKLTGFMRKKSGSLEGVKLKEGESTDVVVSNGQTLHLSAEGRAQVEITNHSDVVVKAECFLGAG